MGKADVIQAIFDSFELIKLHWREVIIPLAILMLVSAAGGMGGSSFSNSFGGRGSSSSSSLLDNSMITNAMSDAGSSFLALGGLLLAVVLAIVALAIVITVLDQALWFYVYEHFYSLLCKKKIRREWQERMIGHSLRAIALMVFWLALLALIFALPVLQAWNVISSIQQLSVSSIVPVLSSIVAPLMLGFLVLLVVGFLLTPLWIYYVMDGFGFFESVSKSLSLVAGNLGTFLIFALLFFLLHIGAAIVSFAACCFSFIVSPIASVFVALLSGVTLMKIKLQLEK